MKTDQNVHSIVEGILKYLEEKGSLDLLPQVPKLWLNKVGSKSIPISPLFSPKSNLTPLNSKILNNLFQFILIDRLDLNPESIDPSSLALKSKSLVKF